MTLTSFLDVKNDPPKSDETKVDLLQNLNVNDANRSFNGEDLPTTERSPTVTVGYLEVYDHRAARRRRLCRIFAWLLVLFLLLDIGAVLYIGLRMRQHSHSADGGDSDGSTFTCRLRFRRPDGQVESHTELLSAKSDDSVLMQPSWDSDGRPTVLHNQARGITLLRAPSAKLCFVKHAPKRRPDWAKTVASWAKKSHEVAPDSIHLVRLVVRYPALSERELMSYGSLAWQMCRTYRTYIVEPALFRLSFSKNFFHKGASTADEHDECPMVNCRPCPSGVYLHDSKGCRTCRCGSASADEEEPENRRKRAAPELPKETKQPEQQQKEQKENRRRQLQIDEGVLPADDGRSVHTVDVIEF